MGPPWGAFCQITLTSCCPSFYILSCRLLCCLPLHLANTVLISIWTVHHRRSTRYRYGVLFLELRRGRDETYRRCELITLTFDLGGHGACRWCGSTSSIRTPTLKFLGLTVRKTRHIVCVCVSRPFDLETGAQCSTCHCLSINRNPYAISY